VIPAPLNVASDTGQLRVRNGVRAEYTDVAREPIVGRFCQDVARRTGLQLEHVLDHAALKETAPKQLP
jgi:hypothetical protein